MKRVKISYHKNGRASSISRYNKYGQLACDSGNYVMCSFHENGKLSLKCYITTIGRFHRIDGPAIESFNEKGDLIYISHYIMGRRHCEYEHAQCEWDDNGKITFEAWTLNDVDFSSRKQWMKKLPRPLRENLS